MKKISILILFVVLSITQLKALWEECNNGFVKRSVLSIFSRGKVLFASADQNNGIFLSTDYGMSWYPKNSGLDGDGTERDIHSLLLVDSNVFMGTWDGIYLSTDMGNNWSNSGLRICQYDFLHKNIINSISISGNNVFAGTECGIALSNDMGKKWIYKNSGLSGKYAGAIFITENKIFIGADSGVFLSTDMGDNWISKKAGLSNPFVSSFVLSGNNLLAGTNGGGIFISTDYGDNWSKTGTGLTNDIIFSLIVKGDYIFAGTFGGGVFLSTDLGNNWTEINLGLTDLYVLSLSVTDNYIFAGTRSGIFRAKIEDLVGVEDSPQLSKFTISPNPSTDNIFISFSNSDETNKSISIFNSLGIEVKRIGHEELSGKSSISVSTESLPSGVYFCTYVSGTNKLTKRFVVVR